MGVLDESDDDRPDLLARHSVYRLTSERSAHWTKALQ